MIEIGKKDKIFVAVVLPLALIGGYFHFWRMPVMHRLSALEGEYRQLPDPDSFPIEKRNLAARLAEAEEALAAARAEAPVEATVEGDAQAVVASRLEQVLSILTTRGVRIVRVEAPAENESSGEGNSDSRGASTLAATGLRPSPDVRKFVVEADYPAFVATLEEFARRKMPVVSERISLTVGERTSQWEMTLWL